MAHRLGLGVVAEGVETEEVAHLLRDEECDLLQGYWISKPMAPDQVPGWLEQYAARPQIQKG